MEETEGRSFEDTPTWVVAVVCSTIILLSLLAERGLHKLGLLFKKKGLETLFEALQKLKDELMLLGFISLLLTVTQGLSKHLCIPHYLSTIMLPCKTNEKSSQHEIPFAVRHETDTMTRRLLTADTSTQHCAIKGKVPMVSLEALHQLHIFIFVMALVHVFFCAITMLLGGARVRQWRHWENSRRAIEEQVNERARSYRRKHVVVSWLVAFFKQFHDPVTKSDYLLLRSEFIEAHIQSNPDFNFHKYMLRTLEHDFKKIVGISWYLWVFVVLFLLINIAGWHTYFWMSFLPITLLLLVGTKLEHIITELAQAFAERESKDASDELFWFKSPKLVLHLIHFILFQNSFEIAFFFWIASTYGFRSCIMERLGFTIPKLVMGLIVQVLCSYSTFPLYALVTQMGSSFKQGMFDQHTHAALVDWAQGSKTGSTARLRTLPFEGIAVSERPAIRKGPPSTIPFSRYPHHI
ncbi:unnamed protein product [Cuscuta europaea]|uniref:MLO-like protein n=1 Tax=Cuscuta europaea TaxID=41803 RepID=A0A9P0YMX0_CUSEU|nr:unnamed protein product [Cuscuta europaea]